MTTTTLRYSTNSGDAARLAIARVAAAGRVRAEREALVARLVRESREDAEYAALVIADLRAEGATQVGFKICGEYGKWRTVRDIEDAGELIASTRREDAEVWGLDAHGEHTGGACW